MLTAALLANFFDAGWAIQVLVSDMDSHQYFASRLARPEIEKHLYTMIASAKALPPEVRAQMPMVDWPAWITLEDALPCTDETRRQRVWTAIENWLPPHRPPFAPIQTADAGIVCVSFVERRNVEQSTSNNHARIVLQRARRIHSVSSLPTVSPAPTFCNLAQHRGGKQQGNGIGDAFAGDVWGGAVHGFKDCRVLADVGTRRHTQTTDEAGNLV